MMPHLIESPEEWTCGHVATAVCADCYKILVQRANELQAECDRLMDLVQQYEIRFSRLVNGA